MGGGLPLPPLASAIDAWPRLIALRPHQPGSIRLAPPLPGLADGQGFRTDLHPLCQRRETDDRKPPAPASEERAASRHVHRVCSISCQAFGRTLCASGLEWKMQMPIQPRRPVNQKPCNIGLFDEDARNQLSLFDDAQGRAKRQALQGDVRLLFNWFSSASALFPASRRTPNLGRPTGRRSARSCRRWP